MRQCVFFSDDSVLASIINERPAATLDSVPSFRFRQPLVFPAVFFLGGILGGTARAINSAV